jgi:Rne/Rng family ribonuclease
MAKEICISSTPHETRLAILEDDQLAEIYYERENEYTLAGSVYKGRVTRVLPGMQSAFVDIGLERDAFLYVTDFLEMEDQEDTDEVERASSQGNTVRQQPASQPQSQLQDQAPGQSQGRPRSERGPRREMRPPPPEPGSQILFQSPDFDTPEETEYSADSEVESIPASVAEAASREEETESQNARRGSGRRRRRGGRGRDGADRATPSTATTGSGEESEEADEPVFEPALEFEAAASQSPTHSYSALAAGRETAAPEQSPRGGNAPAPFLLPGESLSKYGAAAIQKSAPSRLILSELPPDTSDPLPERTVAKPSTLVEDEFVWDGKSLFPGESLARHRKSAPGASEPVFAEPTHSEPVQAEPIGVFATHSEAAVHHEEVHEEIRHEEIQHEEITHEAAPFEFSEPVSELVHEHIVADEPVESEEFETEDTEEFDEFEEEAQHPSEVHATSEHTAIHTHEEVEHEEIGHEETRHEEIHDASASHNVDPLPPSSFRFKDLFGGGRKKEEESTPAFVPETPKKVAHVSSYAPGDGLVEEETIDEEEYEFTPLKAHHGDEHDSEDLEEETLQAQIRSGALGEMLQEAHMESHMGKRIQLESADDEEEGEEGVAASSGRPAQGGGRERSGDRGRGRGGRGGRGGSDRSSSTERSSSSDRSSSPERSSSPDRSDRSSSSGRSGGDGRRGPSRRSAQTSDLPIISDLLKPGQEILVQIAKEPIAKKGARITSHIALPGRFLVFMPTVSHVGVSRKIASDEERQRLKRILVSEKGDATGGFIVRTAADGASEEELRADLRFLINLWNEIKTRADASKPPALIYHDLNLIERILRDQVSDNFSHIWVDSEADYERIVRFLNRFSPELVRRVKLYTKEVPLFEHFGIQDEISKALRSKVWLKSGGSIVINQTEALVAIDINTGKYVGKTARLEDTILKTNLDSIPEIVRQIRLRDLGGIIVIDFIDMDERKNRARVMAALEEALKQDRAPTKVLQFNDFGLVAITRKRVKQSLERTLSVPCPVCQATGMVKSAATVANEIYVEVRKMKKHFDQTDVMVRVNPETAKALKANNAKWLNELEDLTGKNVLVKSDPTLHPEQFDIQG